MRLQNERNPIYSVVFYPNGKQIVSAGWNDRTARIWDSSTGAELLTLHEGGRRKYCVAFSPDGKAIVGGTSGWFAVFWDSTAPIDGYEARKAGIAARKLVDELHEAQNLYARVIDKLKVDETLDESVRKIALKITNARLWEDEDDSKESVDDESKK